MNEFEINFCYVKNRYFEKYLFSLDISVDN